MPRLHAESQDIRRTLAESESRASGQDLECETVTLEERVAELEKELAELKRPIGDPLAPDGENVPTYQDMQRRPRQAWEAWRSRIRTAEHERDAAKNELRQTLEGNGYWERQYRQATLKKMVDVPVGSKVTIEVI